MDVCRLFSHRWDKICGAYRIKGGKTKLSSQCVGISVCSWLVSGQAGRPAERQLKVSRRQQAVTKLQTFGCSHSHAGKGSHCPHLELAKSICGLSQCHTPWVPAWTLNSHFQPLLKSPNKSTEASGKRTHKP